MKILLACVLTIVSMAASSASNVSRIYRGEGSALEAYVGLDKANSFRFHMACRRNTQERKLDLGVWIAVAEKDKVSSEVVRLVEVPEDTKKEMSICLNGVCNARVWQDVGGGECGKGKCVYDLGANLSLNQDQEKIRSLRVVVPNDSANYEFRGDVDGILRRICK